MSRWVAEIASWAMEWPEGHWTGCCLCLSAVAANSLIHYWSSYLSVGVDQYWIFTERWNVNFQTFWKLTFHWSVKKHPLGNKVNKCLKMKFESVSNVYLHQIESNMYLRRLAKRVGWLNIWLDACFSQIFSSQHLPLKFFHSIFGPNSVGWV